MPARNEIWKLYQILEWEFEARWESIEQGNRIISNVQNGCSLELGKHKHNEIYNVFRDPSLWYILVVSPALDTLAIRKKFLYARKYIQNGKRQTSIYKNTS